MANRPTSTDAKPQESTGVSVIYTTHRLEPRFDWFIDSLAAQLSEEIDLEVIFVDGLHSPQRTAALDRLVDGRFSMRHVAPKPSPYSGPYRLTGRDYFTAASFRNTGIVYASKEYIVFVDDASVAMPGWLDEALNAARGLYVVAGAYEKRWEMVVDDGKLISSREDPVGRDARWEHGDDDRLVEIVGGQLFGCSCGAPRRLLVEVNGYDELCDLIGSEDYDLGLRLERSGAAIYYSRRMLTIESEELHRQGEPLARMDKAADEQTYMQRLLDFGVDHRSTDGPCDISHLVLDINYGTRAVRSLGNYYDLAELDESNLLDTVECFPRYHWFDQQPLNEL